MYHKKKKDNYDYKSKFQVSEEEVLSAFKYLDTNQNGWITIDELANLPNKMAELVRFKEAPLVFH